MEEFFTTPGTRAMGMGGAFVAQATDSSALWYNPAGLGFSKGIDVTLDYGDVVAAKGHDDGSISADGYYTSEKEIKYLAYNMWGFGMAYFRPYNFYAGANNLLSGGVEPIHTSYTELKMGYGFALGEAIAVGGTLDVIYTELSCDDCFDAEQVDYGFTLGMLGRWMIIEKYETVLKYGVVFRSAAEMETEMFFEDYDQLPGRPGAFSVGLSLGMPLVISEEGFYFTASLQLDQLNYDDVIYVYYQGKAPVYDLLDVDEERVAWGVEISFYPANDLIGFVRFGGAQTQASESSGPHPKGTESVTWGVGATYKNLTLDFAMESMEVKSSGFFSDFADQENTRASMSVSLSF